MVPSDTANSRRPPVPPLPPPPPDPPGRRAAHQLADVLPLITFHQLQHELRVPAALLQGLRRIDGRDRTPPVEPLARPPNGFTHPRRGPLVEEGGPVYTVGEKSDFLVLKGVCFSIHSQRPAANLCGVDDGHGVQPELLSEHGPQRGPELTGGAFLGTRVDPPPWAGRGLVSPTSNHRPVICQFAAAPPPGPKKGGLEMRARTFSYICRKKLHESISPDGTFPVMLEGAASNGGVQKKGAEKGPEKGSKM